jgi:hypothetical protein
MTGIGVRVGIEAGASVKVGVGEGVNVGGIGGGVWVGRSRVGVSGTTRVFVGGTGVGVQVGGMTTMEVGVLVAGESISVGVKVGSARIAD